MLVRKALKRVRWEIWELCPLPHKACLEGAGLGTSPRKTWENSTGPPAALRQVSENAGKQEWQPYGRLPEPWPVSLGLPSR